MFNQGIYAILDGDHLGLTSPVLVRAALDRLVQYAQAAVDAGAVAVQLRLKGLAVGDLVCAETMAALSAVAGQTCLLVNDDPAAAAALAPPSGLHVGQGDLTVAAARRLLGPATLIGLSTHDLRQVAAAALLPVDYLGFGPVRVTLSKRNAHPPAGLDGLVLAVAHARQPVVAIGGLRAEDLSAVRRTGAHAAAVIGAWLGDPKHPHAPPAAARALAALVAGWGRV